MERLQKVLARAGVASRRGAERLIEQGRVTVNGTVVDRLGTRVDADRDAVKVDGRRIAGRPSVPTYLVLNKPKGYVTTLSDPEGRSTVADLLKGVRARVFPVGRLDYSSEGLLLLTDDGELAQRLMHPRHSVEKTYAVKVRGTPDAGALRRLARGVPLDGKPTRPARVRLVSAGDNSWLEVSVVEGRKHLVRRMLLSVGHRVLKLRRTAYAGLRLGRLTAGNWRRLTSAEVGRLKRVAKVPGGPPAAGRRSALIN